MSRALLSVTDKSGLVDFARGLAERGVELVSTGGTAQALRGAGLTVMDVSDLTGFPEMLDGRVKTLHPHVHAGVLADRRIPAHVQQLEELGVMPFDLVVVNLYRFEATVTAPHTWDEAVESIDIGGPSLIRGAAKNHANVTVIVDPADYEAVLAHPADPVMRRKLAAKAFRHTAYYDSVIARYFTAETDEEPFSETLTVGLQRQQGFRYGENPHQLAAWYRDPLQLGGIAAAEALWGKELSYNNLLDSEAAWGLALDLPEGGCAIIKHGNPCGAAIGGDLGESYRIARASDPISAFGGIAAFHGIVDESAALAMTEKGNFLEVVLGFDFTAAALELFRNRSGWGQDVRLLRTQPNERTSYSVRSVGGGVIVQASDPGGYEHWRIVTDLEPTEAQTRALQLQWSIVTHVKSNGIVVGTEDRLLGVGAGQMNRVQSVRLALEQAGEAARGAVLASDAFFPFPDSIETAARAGIAAIVQPGGSKKDDDVVAAANQLGIAMVLTGRRHFRH